MTSTRTDPDEYPGGATVENSEPMGDGDQDPLVRAPTMAELYGPGQLAQDRNRELVSLAELPGWIGGKNPNGHGWGAELDRVVGGGICQGFIAAIGASTAGAGKTAFLMQLADGLALRTAELVESKGSTKPLTPVLILSEMSARDLSWRSLARWTGHDSRIFRAGKSAVTLLGGELSAAGAAAKVWGDAEAALDQGSFFARARQFQRVYCPPLGSGGSGQALLDNAQKALNAWTECLKTEHGQGREVWPVVVVDPVQRWQSHGTNEVEALNELAEGLRYHADNNGWVVLATSDTNKSAAKGDLENKTPQEKGAGVFRGTYKLMHIADVALYLESGEPDNGKSQMTAHFVKNRWGTVYAKPRFTWDVKTGRFETEGKARVIERPSR